MSMGNFPESLSQGILVGIILVGRLGVQGDATRHGCPIFAFEPCLPRCAIPPWWGGRDLWRAAAPSKAAPGEYMFAVHNG